MTVKELIVQLLTMPLDVTVMMSDSQHGDHPVTKVEDTTDYAGGRVVLLDWW